MLTFMLVLVRIMFREDLQNLNLSKLIMPLFYIDILLVILLRAFT